MTSPDARKILVNADADASTSGWIDNRTNALARVWVKAEDRTGTAAATVTLQGAVDADGTAAVTLKTFTFTAAGVQVWDENTAIPYLKVTTSSMTTARVNAWLTGKG
jgi:hypothetical protein